MMLNRRRRDGASVGTLALIAAVLVGAALHSRPARADDLKAPAISRNEGRQLGDHLFLLTPIIRDPFATTYLDMRTIEGLAQSQGALFNPTGMRTGTRDYNLAIIAEAIEYQLAPLDWLVARVGVTGFVYSGSSALAVVAVGAVIRYEVSGGVTASQEVSRRVRLGVAFDFSYGRRESFDILTAVSQSIQDRQINSSAILQSANVLALSPGVNAAFALHRSLGLVVAVNYINSSLGDGSLPTGDHTLAPGAALDFDLGAFLPVPIGFLAAYRWDVPLSDGGESQTADLGIFYTGRRDLNLSLQIGWRHFPLRQDFRADAELAAIVMRYYW